MKRGHKAQLRICKEELKKIGKIIRKSPLSEEASFLTSYALIKVCGTVELIFKEIIADYCDKARLREIQCYIDRNVRRSSKNPKYDLICRELGKFSLAWNNDFKCEIENTPNSDRIIASINSLVINRNNFAHGNNYQATFGDINRYFEDSIIILKKLYEVVNKKRVNFTRTV